MKRSFGPKILAYPAPSWVVCFSKTMRAIEGPPEAGKRNRKACEGTRVTAHGTMARSRLAML